MNQISHPDHRRPGWGLILLLSTCLLDLSSPSLAEPTVPVDSLLVKGFSFSGNTVISQAELEALTQPNVGRSLTLTDLEEVAASVADLYKQKGERVFMLWSLRGMREELFEQTVRYVPYLFQLNGFVATRLWCDIDSLKPMSPLFKDRPQVVSTACCTAAMSLS
jgi:hypothetical protein